MQAIMRGPGRPAVVDALEASMAEEADDSKEHARPRKRTRRACDKCSASRTRCNGAYPW
ncbi:hypothetical protein M406DRAFT_341050 [Cryphonectria parasitica EP155]|uniref:Zn(2)-C6 fungal-type domain-containing protein n=1 Tax=Cryphonectria parasitica (strain ATCC 38755 / EP155) TaxID=660469 RepID=A0A9P5CMS4_CRYP1|nr:uncharacterized protein M406DRAFT_341050 [Cryphonectria parasitica EP155]KAF3763562.1 hypothetical protein M406DRAFT_341050 [Cryphonectria parasitica EP155]